MYKAVLVVVCALAISLFWLLTLVTPRRGRSQAIQTPVESTMHICAVSDPHGRYVQLNVPQGDMMLFGGDVELDSKQEATEFAAWLKSLPQKHKVMTFGNMDHAAEDSLETVLPILAEEATVCLDEIKDVGGFRIFGSPFTPEFYGSFQLSSYEDAKRHWEKVLPPTASIDIIISHGPPFGHGDVTNGAHVGDKALLEAVQRLEKSPKLWVCGHIHSARGIYKVPHTDGDILLINAALPRDPQLRSFEIDFATLQVQEGLPSS